MQERSERRWKFARSGFVVLLALVLALSPFAGLGMSAEAVEVEAAGVEALQEWMPGMYPITFWDSGFILDTHWLEPGSWFWPGQFFPMFEFEDGFIGWCTAGDGSLLVTSQLIMVYRPMALLAVWESGIVRHPITFHPNIHHAGPLPVRHLTVSHGQPIGWDNVNRLRESAPSPESALLGVVASRRAGGLPFFLNMFELAEWIVEEPLLFLVWWAGADPDLLQYPVTFNLNGGSVEGSGGPLTFYAQGGMPLGTSWGLLHTLSNLYRPGYNFIGWCWNGSDLWNHLELGAFVPWLPFEFTAMWEPDGNAPCADTNLARAATMSASSAQGVRTADRANNGIREGAVTNSWFAAGIGQEWLMVDFGEPVNFNHIRIFQAANRIANYRFEYSNDGVNWTTFRSGNRIMEATPAYYGFTTDTTIQARFVRLFSENSIGVTPIAVFEFEVFYMP